MRQDERVVSMEMSHAETAQRSFLLRVYHWMTLGLALTGLVALYMASKPEMVQTVMTTPGLFFGLLIGELVLVFYLAARVMRMSPGRAMTVFLLYSALNGVTFSVIFLAYTKSTIASAFFVTAGTFAATSLYGYVTKRDLSGMGSFLFMGLIGLIIASVVNLFLRSPAIYWITTYGGVLIFVGLTAYDTQKLKRIHQSVAPGSDMETKAAISGALALYLDFINLFLFILRIMGGRK
jgi:FtsH-binding integral membrane protein